MGFHSTEAAAYAKNLFAYGVDAIDSAEANSTISAISAALGGRGILVTVGAKTAGFLSKGRPFTISGTTNYDGRYRIANAISTTQFIIRTDWIADEAAGTVDWGNVGPAYMAAYNPGTASIDLAAVVTNPVWKDAVRIGALPNLPAGETYVFPEILMSADIVGVVELVRWSNTSPKWEDISTKY